MWSPFGREVAKDTAPPSGALYCNQLGLNHSSPAWRYRNAALGDIIVSQNQGAIVFDFGEWRSEVASRKNPDGTVSFITTVPGLNGFEFVVGSGARRTLTVRDAQHEYVFAETAAES
jgi:hypothetical protein